MNGYGPALPATGGGFGIGLIWGIHSQLWIVVFFSAIALLIILYSFLRLVKGEKEIKD